MNKYTPGPWETNGTNIQEAGGGLIAIAASVCRPNKEDLANARLIAAAPKLLEALKGLLWAINLDHPEAHDAVASAEEAARAAIAEAIDE